MAPETISRLLDDNAELQPVTARLAYIRRLQRRYRNIVPRELAEASRVCAIDGTTVVICADNGTVASVLRHLAPRMLEGLREAARKSSKHAKDQELTSIRVEVQVKFVTKPAPARARGEMPVEKLSALARKLGDSPLRKALEEIAGRDQRRRTRPKT
ncbi:MAG TPA: DciA family protein [Gemmatimonadaceae bacterium]|nr:DciA family protein [Gemmatimonadaceae bacterium]